MARRAINPLLDLAWACMSEQAIVAKVAAQCRARHLSWRRGEIGDIRAIVKESRPPRGVGKKRTEAVAEEIDRQNNTARERMRNRPIDWGAWKPDAIEYRRQRVGERRIRSTGRVQSLSKVNGSLIFLVEGPYSWHDNRVVILRPRPVCGPQHRIVISVKCGHTHASEAILSTFWHTKVRSAFMQQRKVTLDWDRLETVIESSQGTERIPWTKENARK